MMCGLAEQVPDKIRGLQRYNDVFLVGITYDPEDIDPPGAQRQPLSTALRSLRAGDMYAPRRMAFYRIGNSDPLPR